PLLAPRPRRPLAAAAVGDGIQPFVARDAAVLLLGILSVETVCAGELVSHLHDSHGLPPHGISFYYESPVDSGCNCSLISSQAVLAGGLGAVALLFVGIVSIHRAV